MKIEKIELKIAGMTCEHCAKSIEKKLDQFDGIAEREVSYSDALGSIKFDAEKISKSEIIEIINSTKSYKVVGEIPAREEEAEKVSLRKNSGKFDTDLLIIGGGSAAFAAALKASEMNKKVIMFNDMLPIGGTCVNVGCVPSKTLIRTAEAFHNANHPNFKGIIPGKNKIDFQEVIRQKRELVEDLRQKKYLDVIQGDGNIKIIRARAKLIDNHTIEAGGENYSADTILIATGSSTFVPNYPGLDEIDYYTNDTLYELDNLPEHLIVIGGRYIALENAQLFARLGSKVTILQRSKRILPDESTDITETLTDYLREEGIEIITGVKINNFSKSNGNIKVHFSVDGEEITLEGTHILIATGRKGNTDELGLENVGISTYGNGFIKTDIHNCTRIRNIYATGDVTGEHLFVYTAAYSGALAVENAFGEEKKAKDFSVLPWVIFTDPQVAGVGMDENQAYKAGIDYDTSTLWMKDVPRAIAARNSKGFIKLIRNKSNDKLIGARILASEGSELLMEIALAIKYGITVNELKQMFHPYLTLSEAVKLAAVTFDKDVNSLSCCAV